MRQLFYKAKLGTKLTLTTWTLATVPILLIFFLAAAVFVSGFRDTARREAEARLAAATRQIELVLARSLDGADSLALDLNIQNAIHLYNEADYKTRLDMRDLIRNALASHSVADSAARSLVLYLNDSAQSFWRDQSEHELARLLKGQDWFSDLLAGRAEHHVALAQSLLEPESEVVVIARSIRSMRTGRPIGVVYKELPWADLARAFDPLLQSSDDELWLGDAVLRQGGDAPSGYRPIRVTGRIDALNLTLSYQRDPVEMRPSIQRLLLVFGGGMALLLLLSLWASRRFTAWLTRRIEGLLALMDKIAGGHFEQSARDLNRDELALLEARLLRMGREMKLLIERNYLAEIENQAASLRALQAQINPHFIYNTLDSIAMLALIHDHYDLVDMVQGFSEMMRYIMKPDIEVALKEELAHVRHYLSVQRIRFPGELRWDCRVEDACLDSPLPRLCLQILVENAFQHGFSPDAAAYRLLLSVRKRGDRLLIRVLNDGKAIDAARLNEVRRYLSREALAKQGVIDCYALRNLLKRLYLMFGDTLSFRLYSEEKRGTLTRISLPLRRALPEGKPGGS